MRFNPATVANLVRLMMGGLHHGNRTLVAAHPRALLRPGRAAAPACRPTSPPWSRQMTGDETVLTLVNVSPVHARRVIVQAGGYGEHEFTSMETEGKKEAIDARSVTVHLDPGAGARLVLGTRRYVHQPTFAPVVGSGSLFGTNNAFDVLPESGVNVAIVLLGKLS